MLQRLIYSAYCTVVGQISPSGVIAQLFDQEFSEISKIFCS